MFMLTWIAFEVPVVNILKYYMLMFAYDICFTAYGIIRIYMNRERLVTMNMYNVIY